MTGLSKIDVGVVLGSGHKNLADEVDNSRAFNYADIPYFPIPTNIGHGRELVVGQLMGRSIILFKGRIHLFEGYRSFYHSWLGYMCAFLGVELLVSTNSCGAISTELHVGDFVIMSDHFNASYLPFLNGKHLYLKLI
jgi:purine-nucleoside phosphorylase